MSLNARPETLIRMPALVAGIHVFLEIVAQAWMAGSSLVKPGHDG
jgi:hypothetical protein